MCTNPNIDVSGIVRYTWIPYGKWGISDNSEYICVHVFAHPTATTERGNFYCHFASNGGVKCLAKLQEANMPSNSSQHLFLLT